MFWVFAANPKVRLTIGRYVNNIYCNIGLTQKHCTSLNCVRCELSHIYTYTYVSMIKTLKRPLARAEIFVKTYPDGFLELMKNIRLFRKKKKNTQNVNK